MRNTLSQDAIQINLEWIAGDPVTLSFVVAGTDWSGTYTSHIRNRRNPSSTLIAELTVTATFDGTDTEFMLSLANSTQIPEGTYYWDCQAVGGKTFFSGSVNVKPQVTA